MKRFRLWLAHRAEAWAFDQQMRYGERVELNVNLNRKTPRRTGASVTTTSNPSPATFSGVGADGTMTFTYPRDFPV